ncbi:hypothetical protein WDW89_02600 [Deltaproteobacteria bacterium TL4]
MKKLIIIVILVLPHLLFAQALSKKADSSGSKTLVKKEAPPFDAKLSQDRNRERGGKQISKQKAYWIIFDHNVENINFATIKKQIQQKGIVGLDMMECQICGFVYHRTIKVQQADSISYRTIIVRGLENINNRLEIAKKLNVTEFQVIYVEQKGRKISAVSTFYNTVEENSTKSPIIHEPWLLPGLPVLEMSVGGLILPIGLIVKGADDKTPGLEKIVQHQASLIGMAKPFTLIEPFYFTTGVTLFFDDNEKIKEDQRAGELTGFLIDGKLEWAQSLGWGDALIGIGIGQMQSSLFTPFYFVSGGTLIVNQFTLSAYYLNFIGNDSVVSEDHPVAIYGYYLALGWAF